MTNPSLQEIESLISICINKVDAILPCPEKGTNYRERGVSNLLLPLALSGSPSVLESGPSLDGVYEETFSKEARRSKGIWLTPTSLALSAKAAFLDSSLPGEDRVVDLASGTGRLLLPFVNEKNCISHKVVGIEQDPLLAFIGKINFISQLHSQGHIFNPAAPIEIPIYNTDSLADFAYADDLLWDGNIIVNLEEDSFALPSCLFSTFDHISLVREQFGHLAKKISSHALSESENRFMEKFQDAESREIHRHRLADALVPHLLHQTRSQTKLMVLNPPWVPYRLLEPFLQDKLRNILQQYGLWNPGNAASQMDSSLLFSIVGVDKYLSFDGEFVFFLPAQIMTGKIYESFQIGHFRNFSIDFEEILCLPMSEETFPVNATFVKGKKTNQKQTSKSKATLQVLTQTNKATYSYYGRNTFHNGATLFPKALMSVEGLSIEGEHVAFSVATKAREKPPWRDLPRKKGVVEERFLHPVLEGSTLLPFGLWKPSFAILPIDKTAKKILFLEELREYKLMESWWGEMEGLWEDGRTVRTRSLVEQIDHMKKLQKQVSSPQGGYRVAYSASGRSVSAAVVPRDIIVTHSFYWSDFPLEEEAHYLVAVLNSKTAFSRLPPIERHIDKSILDIRIPRYRDSEIPNLLAHLGKKAYQEFPSVASNIQEGMKFRQARDVAREKLSLIYEEIEEATEILFENQAQSY